jgi:hypothetical protein
MKNNSKLALKIWFLIIYVFGIIGALVGEWEDAGSGYGFYKVSFSEQLSNLFTRIFSLAGIIDTFVFPSMASAITISSAIYFYRRVSSRLVDAGKKPLLVILFIFTTFLIWIIQSFILAGLLS